MMEIDSKYKNFIKLLNNHDGISDGILEKLLDNCCKVLSGQKEDIDFPTLSQALEIKQVYSSLLYIFTQFARNSHSNEELINFMVSDCSIEKERGKIVGDYYKQWFQLIRIQLLNIGSHLPHVTDVRWKIDHIVKSNSLDQSVGPVFRVSLKTEKYDHGVEGSQVEHIEFTCNSQELQDLVYKLKDAVRHCQRLAVGH